MRPALVALALLAAPPVTATAAETAVDAERFETMSTGRTLRFSRRGAPYGAEQYLPGRRVIWQYADGSCSHGFWYDGGEALCFVYEDTPSPQCWIFSRRDGDFFARMAGVAAGDPSELRLSATSPAPLDCPGPDLGA